MKRNALATTVVTWVSRMVTKARPKPAATADGTAPAAWCGDAVSAFQSRAPSGSIPSFRIARTTDEARSLRLAAYKEISGAEDDAGIDRIAADPSLLAEVYPTLRKISVDFAVMEPASRDPLVRVAAVPMNLNWLDVGSWPMFARTCPTDAQGNFDFALDLPSFIAGSELEGGQGRFYLQATVIDQAQHTEVLNLSLPVTAKPVVITTTDGMIENPTDVASSADGKTVFYCTNAKDIERRHIWAVPVTGGTPVQITTGTGIETYPTPLASGRHLATLSASWKMPLLEPSSPANSVPGSRLTPKRRW